MQENVLMNIQSSIHIYSFSLGCYFNNQLLDNLYSGGGAQRQSYCSSPALKLRSASDFKAKMLP